jgi:hypothetical protein
VVCTTNPAQISVFIMFAKSGAIPKATHCQVKSFLISTIPKTITSGSLGTFVHLGRPGGQHPTWQPSNSFEPVEIKCTLSAILTKMCEGGSCPAFLHR